MTTRAATAIPALLTLLLTVAAAPAQYPNDNSPLGINPSGFSDWSEEVAFIDMFCWFRGWENHDSANGNMPAEQLDSSGWPEYVNAGQEVTVGHGAGTDGHFPGGRYLFTWEGEGTFSPRMGCTFVSTDMSNKRIVIQVDSTQQWWGIRLNTTNTADHARNMHCWLPGFWDEDTYQLKPQYVGNPWHPEYLRTLERFEHLRFMGLLGTNGSTVRHWEDLKPARWWNQGHSDHFGFGHTSPAWCIDLANRVHADAWINIPHLADDTLVRKFAELVRDSLDQDLKVYVEYSNECWNWAYPFSLQAGYCTNMGDTIGLPGNGPAEYFAYRCAQIWQIFDEVFGAQSDRVVKVLAWQVGTDFSWHFDILENAQWNPNSQWPDMCAIAPYIHNSSIPLGIPTSDFIDSTINTLIPELRSAVRTSAAAAAGKGCRIAAYEANQHFHSDVPAAMTYYLSVKHDPRIEEMLLTYMTMIDEEMDGPLSMFISHGRSIWGAREWYNQPREEAYLWDAMLTYIEGIAGYVSVVPRAASPSPHAPIRFQQRAPGPVFSLLGRGLQGGAFRAPLGLRDTGGALPAPGAYVVSSGRATSVSIIR